MAAVLGSAVLGFLVFNFNPASIFMGDSGSMFLGFMLSGTALLSETGRFRGLTSVLLTPVLILLIPIFDTCVVTITRKLSGRPISQGGRDHTSHRLVALGMSERRAVLMLYAFAAVSGMLALMVRLLETSIAIAVVPAFALLALFLGLYLGQLRIYEDGEPPQGLRIINAFADFTYKRRIFEVLAGRCADRARLLRGVRPALGRSAGRRAARHILKHPSHRHHNRDDRLFDRGRLSRALALRRD